MRWRWLVSLAMLGALVVACGDQRDPASSEAGDSPPASTSERAHVDDEDETDTTAGEQDLQVAVSSFDLAVGDGQRFTAGLLLEDQGVLVGGEARMDLFYLGEDNDGEQLATAMAGFLPVPGMEPEPVPSEPRHASDQEVGIYETRFDFNRPGLYGVGVRVELDGQTLVGTGTFEVAEETAVVDVGEPAPLEPNATLADDVAPEVLDSRARDGGELPDPHLHQTTLEDALQAGNRALVLISTPVYCMSRFCGPITEQFGELAEGLPDDVDAIHIEVWQDFDNQQMHPAAEAWVATEEGATEPWLFAVDRDGTIIGRWDNVADIDAARDLVSQ